MEVENKTSKGHTHVQWAVTILVNMIIFTYGLQSGWLSPMTKVLQTTESPAGRPLTDSETALLAGTGSLTAMAGIPILTYIVDRFGRKWALTVMSFFQLMCWIIKIFTAAPAGLIVARMFCGLGAGGCFLVVPLYIKEISQDNIRGTLGTIFALFQNGGILVMYALGAYLNYYTVLYVVMGLPVLTIALILFKAPESPSFLVKIGKVEILLGVTFAVSGLALLGLGSLEVLRTYGWTTSGWVSVAAVMIIVCCYGAGVNPIPCIISAEIFNFQIRAKLMGLLSFLAWFVTFVQLVSYTAINNYLGTHVTFYTFCLANFLAVAVVVIFLPETRGKTVEQIEAKLRKGN